MRAWYDNNSYFVTAGAIVATGNPEVLNVFSSGAFGYVVEGSRLNAPFSSSARRMLMLGGLVNSILEDIPQFILQAVRSSLQENLNY